MDKETLLKSLAGTIDADLQVRKQSEEQLKYYEELPGFTAYLLDLITDASVNFGVQTSAAIFFKNRVNNYWVVDELKNRTPRHILEEEKQTIKSKLVEVLSKTYKNAQLRVQLSTAISFILDLEKWDQFAITTENLINDVTNIDHVYTGLLCLFQYTKAYRYAGLDTPNNKNIILDEISEQLFPKLESLASNMVENPSETSDEMLYLILKIFRYATFSNLPPYLQDPKNLGKWCQIHLALINKPLPESVLSADSNESRALNPRVKAVKWCFANMHRLFLRHGGGINTKDKKSDFVHTFLNNFVPEILNAYWSIIEEWTNKKLWFSEASLYHLISFLEQVVETPAYPLLEIQLEAIIKHVILPVLNASPETIEMYEDESEEYIRRFFDNGKENKTADTAAINFTYRLSSSKFSSCGTLLFNTINEVFQNRISDRSNLKYAMQAEGALRVLGTISFNLERKDNPVKNLIDELLHSVVYPEMSQETISKTPWLTARACDTIAIFIHKFNHQNVLHDIFHGVVFCFQQQDQFPIQLTAIDALRTLVEEDYVADKMAQQAPQLMETLLDLSKNFESDILTSVMEVFVEKFAANLEPYANELSYRLMEQFNVLAYELLYQSSRGVSDVDKEYQASGLLNTLTSLVISMCAAPEVSDTLTITVKKTVIFILENSMQMFLTEALEMVESILVNTNKMSPPLWEVYRVCMDTFDMYAYDFFDTFHPFLEAVVRIAFPESGISVEDPNVQSLFKVCFQVLQATSVDPVFAHYSFEVLEYAILSLGKKFVPFMPQFLSEIFKIFRALESEDAFDGFMLHYLSVLKIFFALLHVQPSITLQFLNDNQFTGAFFKLWVKYSGDFQSVYGCKLQILASLSILTDAQLNLLPVEDLIGETVDLLISNLETMPVAIKARQDLLDRESGIQSSKDYENEVEEIDIYDDELEADEAEIEALKITPLDSVNIYSVFGEKTTSLQQNDPARYQIVFGNLDNSQQEVAMRILNVLENHKRQA